MSCCNSDPFNAFTDRLLSTEAGFENVAHSPVFPMQGDDLSVALTIKNISGTGPNCVLQIRGSLDGTFFQDVGGPIARGTFGAAFGSIANIQYKFIQVFATFTNSAGTGNCLFSCVLYGRNSA